MVSDNHVDFVPAIRYRLLARAEVSMMSVLRCVSVSAVDLGWHVMIW